MGALLTGPKSILEYDEKTGGEKMPDPKA